MSVWIVVTFNLGKCNFRWNMWKIFKAFIWNVENRNFIQNCRNIWKKSLHWRHQDMEYYWLIIWVVEYTTLVDHYSVDHYSTNFTANITVNLIPIRCFKIVALLRLATRALPFLSISLFSRVVASLNNVQAVLKIRMQDFKSWKPVFSWQRLN